MTAGREIKVIETALRDGQQCLWATRMTTAMMLPIAEKLDRAGYDAIDMMGSIQFDVCVRYLKENPWERLRMMRQRIRETPLKGGLRSKSLVTFRVLPDDVVRLWVRLLVRNGLRKLSVFDALFDLDNIVDTIKVAQSEGADAGGALVFCESPVHTDELYVEKARTLIERAGITHVMLKDSGGLLTPERVRRLVPKLKAAIGDIPLELHTHCMTGLGSLVYLDGIKAGADVVQTAAAPLANGASQPPTARTVENLRRSGFRVDLDDDAVADFSAYVATASFSTTWAFPLGADDALSDVEIGGFTESVGRCSPRFDPPPAAGRQVSLQLSETSREGVAGLGAVSALGSPPLSSRHSPAALCYLLGASHRSPHPCVILRT